MPDKTAKLPNYNGFSAISAGIAKKRNLQFFAQLSKILDKQKASRK